MGMKEKMEQGGKLHKSDSVDAVNLLAAILLNVFYIKM
jgi:hypothetical protein